MSTGVAEPPLLPASLHMATPLQLDTAAKMKHKMQPFGADLTNLGQKIPLFPQLALLESCAVVTGGVMEYPGSILAIASNCGATESDYPDFEGTHNIESNSLLLAGQPESKPYD